MYMQTYDRLGQAPTPKAELPLPQPRVLTYSTRDVIDKRISVPAQHSLVRLSKNPATNGDAVRMLEEVKAGRLAGIYCVNWKEPAQRALKFGKSWWTVIPPSEDAILMLDPDNPAGGQPLIAFRRELDPRDKEGCGKLKTDKTLTPSPARLDAALLKSWARYRQWQIGQLFLCNHRHTISPVGNVGPLRLCQVEPIVKIPSITRGNPFARMAAASAGLPSSLPPGKTHKFKITVSPSLQGTGRVVNLAVLNNGGANGTATVVPEQITSDTVVTITGGDQTKPGHSGQLKVVARFNDKIIASSAGFSVCAHPHSIKISLHKLVKEGVSIGAIVRMLFESDSGKRSDLDMVQGSEIVDEIRHSEPPFKRGSGIFTGAGTVGGKFHELQFFPASAQNLGDFHIQVTPDAGPRGAAEFLQLFVFRCSRCRMSTPVVVPNSGFNIIHEVFRSGKKWKYRFKKIPLAVSTAAKIDGMKFTFKSRPGIGSVTLPDQDLP